MIKRIICSLIIISTCLTLCGCWNYVGLNELSLVMGVAIDKDQSSGKYKLTCELVDLSASNPDGPFKSELVESEGESIFDAIRNAKKRLGNKLYMGNAACIVISHQIAQEDGLQSVVDLFLRNREPRETLSVMISKEKSAKEILSLKAINHPYVCAELRDIVHKDSQFTSSTKSVELYKLYNTCNGQGIEVAMPVIRSVSNDDKDTPESDGIAVFKTNKLVGYLSPEETKYYLFVTDEIEGGVLTFDMEEDKDKTISLEIKKSATELSYSFDEKVKTFIDIETIVTIGESQEHSNHPTDKDFISKVEETANEVLTQRISAVIKKVQNEYNSDIFGFGLMVYRKNPKLWDRISQDWYTYFNTMEFEIRPKFTIINTGFER